MKKIISLLIATALSVTAFTSFVSAAQITSSNKATLAISLAEIDEGDALGDLTTFVEEAELTDYAFYQVTVTAGNLPALAKSGTKYTGEGITAVAARMTITTDAEYEAEWMLAAPAGKGSFVNSGDNYVFSYAAANDYKKLLVAAAVAEGGSQDIATFQMVVDTNYSYEIVLDGGSNMNAAVFASATSAKGTDPYDIASSFDNITVDSTPIELGGAPVTTTYTYTFKTYDGASDIASDVIDEGDDVIAPTAPTRAGYTFVGWATSAGGAAVTIDTTATADTTYYAVYSKDPVPVTGVSLDKSELTFKVGDAAQTLIATVDPSDADVKTVEWSTSDTSVATVENGVVTPVGAGKATITVASTENSEKSASCVVKVNPADVASANFKEIANGTSLADLTGKPVDASKNYGAGRINTDIDTGVFSYQVVATDDAENEKTWDLPSGLEVAGNVNFIAIVKSATHVIKNIFLRGTVK